MPIIRRAAIHDPVASTGSPDFRLPGRPLFEVLRDLRHKASELAWNGDVAEADKLEREALDIQQRIAAGELYEVDF